MSAIASIPAITRFTPEELLRLPEGERFELIDGKLVEREMSVTSSAVAAEIARLLGNEAARTGSARVFGSDLGFRCFPNEPGKVRRGDASVIAKCRMIGLPDDSGFMTVPADVV